jgi:hypothetical protein
MNIKKVEVDTQIVIALEKAEVIKEETERGRKEETKEKMK